MREDNPLWNVCFQTVCALGYRKSGEFLPTSWQETAIGQTRRRESRVDCGTPGRRGWHFRLTVSPLKNRLEIISNSFVFAYRVTWTTFRQFIFILVILSTVSRWWMGIPPFSARMSGIQIPGSVGWLTVRQSGCPPGELLLLKSTLDGQIEENRKPLRNVSKEKRFGPSEKRHQNVRTTA